MPKNSSSDSLCFCLILLLTAGAISSCVSNSQGSTQKESDFAAIVIHREVPWSQRMALSIMKRNPEAWTTDFRQTPQWTYTNGLIMMAMQRLWQASGDEKYWAYAKAYADKLIDEKGQIRGYESTEFNIDHVNAGKILFLLHERTGDNRYSIALQTLREQLKWQPRTTDGGYWHKLRYPWQMWLDGLYMGSPFLAEYGEKFGDSAAFDDVAHQLIIMEKHALDPKTGLLRHGYDESRLQKWSDNETGQSPHVWGRAMGWYAMALVDVLDHLPQNHPQRQALLNILRRTSNAITTYQSKDSGLWYQVIDMAGTAGNYEEATVTCMFAYSLARGVNQGYLEKHHMVTAQKAYQGLIDHLIKLDDQGIMSITKCCAVAGLGGEPYRNGSFDYYVNELIRDNDPKATGPFILASLEFEKMNIDFSK
ncbi:MAG: glycoside hydrolase family 88 protein [Bacteroidia bacterium]|nr:glycoside hydrolase family 88 protein [Bacteroidia bacterium]